MALLANYDEGERELGGTETSVPAPVDSGSDFRKGVAWSDPSSFPGQFCVGRVVVSHHPSLISLSFNSQDQKVRRIALPASTGVRDYICVSFPTFSSPCT